MLQYLDLMKDILSKGVDRSDRTGTGRRSVFGRQLRFNLEDGFPLVTTRKISLEAIATELLWFLSGSTDNNILNENNVSIWNRWAVKPDDVNKMLRKYAEEFKGNEEAFRSFFESQLNNLGPIYGMAWRDAPVKSIDLMAFWKTINIDDIPDDKKDYYEETYLAGIKAIENELADPGPQGIPERDVYYKSLYHSSVDQINELVISLRDRPYSARHVVSAWIPEWLPFEDLSPQENVLIGKAALAPCHALFQCFVYPADINHLKPRLSLQLYLRSSDVPIGLPYNIAQYAMLLSMLAKVSNYEPYELIVSLGDAHIYQDQIEDAKLQITRAPLPLPKLMLMEVDNLFNFTKEDIFIDGYNHHDAINYRVSV